MINPHSGRPVVITDRDGAHILHYQYRRALGFVRVERIENTATGNSHPFVIANTTLRTLLADIKISGGLLSDEASVFTSEELNELVPPLAAALSEAGPKEDICFAVTGKYGVLGKFSAKSVTTGRVFAQDGRLNLVFGLMHEPYESQLSRTDVLRPFTPGSRAARVDTTTAIVPGNGHRTAANRPDWIIFDSIVPPAATLPPGGAKTPATSDAPQLQEIERRLRLLDQLKEKGLISDEEYRERRRAVLQEL